MSVKSNDGGGGAAIQRGQLLCYKCHCCLVFFWYCMEVPDPMGGIVQSVTPSMPGKLNSTCVLVLLFIFKVHFINTCFSHVQCRVYIPGFIQWEAWLCSPLEFWELNRNEHLGSIYF